MKVSVIIPSRGRPEQLRCCIRGLLATTRNHNVEVIAVIDQCPESAAALQGMPVKVLSNSEHQGATACWNQGSLVATGKILVLGADDLVFFKGWLDAALATLEEMGGSGMVGFNDGITPEHAFSPHHMMTRDFIARYMNGCFVIPCYKHQYVDLEATARARRAGKYKWCEGAYVEHRHHAHGLADIDEVYRLGNSYKEADREVFLARQAAGWPNDFDPILR